MGVSSLFLNAHANVNEVNEGLDTPLHLASRHDHVELSTYILSKDARVSAQNKQGATPLQLAAYNGHVEVGKSLSMCWLSFIQNSRRRSSGTKKARCTGEAV